MVEENEVNQNHFFEHVRRSRFSRPYSVMDCPIFQRRIELYSLVFWADQYRTSWKHRDEWPSCEYFLDILEGYSRASTLATEQTVPMPHNLRQLRGRLRQRHGPVSLGTDQPNFIHLQLTVSSAVLREYLYTIKF